MDLTIIAAISEGNVIGVDNKIPWNIPKDMKRFKELTINHPVIMGSNTFYSIPERFRPLVNRKNIVLSSKMKEENGVYIARNIEEALDFVNNEDSYIIGGEKVYKGFLNLANKMELTKIYKYYKGDSFFPKVTWDDWECINELKNTTEDGIHYSFLTYKRK